MFPATLEHLTVFIAHCFKANLASATVQSYMSALSYLMQIKGHSDITQHFIISKTLRGYTKLKRSKDSRLPITPIILKGLIKSLPHICNSLFLQKMLKAMYLLAFHAFLRVGEITGHPPPKGNCLTMPNIKFHHSKGRPPSSIEIHMSQFKHSTGKHIPILLLERSTSQEDLCPVQALWEYIQLRGINLCPKTTLFSFMDNSLVTRRFFTEKLQLSLKFVGLSVKDYKSHSFRIGAATTAWQNGLSEEQIQQMGRWSSQSFKKYIRIPLLKL